MLAERRQRYIHRSAEDEEFGNVDAALAALALAHERLRLAEPLRHLNLRQAGTPPGGVELTQEYGVLVRCDAFVQASAL